MRTGAILTLCVFAFLSVKTTEAQDNIGIAGSNYAPANTVLINPSSIVDNKAYIDINLIGASVFMQNNFVSVPGSVIRLYRGAMSGINPEPSYNLGRKSYFAVADINVHGPSATFQVKKYAFGIYTGIRSVTDARRMTPDMADFAVNGLQNADLFGKEYHIRNLRANTLTWAEAGITAGAIIKQQGTDLFTAGITVKRLWGVMGASAHLDNWDFMVEDSTHMVTYDISGRYGFVEPRWAAGKGWSLDIGFTYKKTTRDVTYYEPHTRQSDCTTCDYQYKISLALLDVGRINFKQPFYYQEFNEGSYDWENYSEFNPDNGEDVNAALSDQFNLAAQSSKFTMWLPTALSAQVDCNLGSNFFVNATYIGGVPWVKTMAPQRGSQIAVTPRYERKRIEFALPVVLHEYRHPHIGAMIRLNSIIIGTDNLGAYLLNTELYGADLYVSIKYTIFRSFGCKQRKPRNRKSGKGVPPCWG